MTLVLGSQRFSVSSGGWRSVRCIWGSLSFTTSDWEEAILDYARHHQRGLQASYSVALQVSYFAHGVESTRWFYYLYRHVRSAWNWSCERVRSWFS